MRRVASYTIVAKRLDGWRRHLVWITEVDIGAGHIVLDWFPALRERGTAPPSFRPMSIVAMVAHLSYCWALVWSGHREPLSLNEQNDAKVTVLIFLSNCFASLSSGEWQFFSTNFSRCSVAAHFRCGLRWILNCCCTRNLCFVVRTSLSCIVSEI